MTRSVRTACYRRPPRRKKPVALEVPAVVRAGPTRRKPAAEKAEGSQKSAIVTIRKRGVAGCRI